jgi:hypothetical protein
LKSCENCSAKPLVVDEQNQGVGAFTFGQVAPLNFLAMRWLPFW